MQPEKRKLRIKVMAKNNKKASENDGFQSIESALTRTESYIESNGKKMVYIFAGLLLVVLIAISYNSFIREPKAQESWSESYKAEFYFAQDSFALALNGDGIYLGFLQIIEDYSGTPIANSAEYYSGVCYMRLGDFESAIQHLNKFNSNDPMVGPMATALIGDANMELGNTESAVKNYIAAANEASNEFLSPAFLMKAGQTYEILENYQEALNIYKKINTEYYNTPQQREIEKFIKRCEMKLQ